jgi:hypothetical protein
MGISKEIPVYTSSYTGTPFLCGIFKPRLVLPDMKLSPAELRCIFLHELTHYKRRDTVLKCLILFINAIHWFNPFAYAARRDIDRQCELACDESIIQPMNNRERRQYCQLTLNVLWNLVDHKAKPASAFSDRRKDAERRIDMILKGNSSKRKLGIRILAVTLTLVLALAGSIVVSADEAPVIPVDTDVIFNDSLLEINGFDEPSPFVSIVPAEEDPVVFSTILSMENSLDDPDSPVFIIPGEESDTIWGNSLPDTNGVDRLNPGVSISESSISPEEINEGSKSSGNLNPKDYAAFHKQTVGEGNTVTLYASWTPTGAELNVGIYSYASGIVYYATLSDGNGSIAFDTNATGDYAIYVGNPSQSIVHFSLSYLIN